MHNKSTRAVGVLLKKNMILLIHRVKNNEDYFVFPGGGVEENETVEEAVLRELKEETSIAAKINRLLYIHYYISSEQHYYLCDYLSGEPKLSDNATEKERMEKEKCDIYEPIWVDVSEINTLLIYPLEIRDWLIEDLKSGFSDQPKVSKLEIGKLRMSLSDKK